ncbi:MAG TPA: hypothetical protein DDX92_04105 [Flavobacteriales bacterium]|nr:hypothetical protein [Flavobacteriales bacterium]
MYDGIYLHIWKYELFKRAESVFEHKTHTIRSILFPLILWLLFLKSDAISFWAGIALFILDLITLGIDAYSERDSRKSLGGLPRWEYILHLFANSFHFAAIALIIATKIKVTSSGLYLNDVFVNSDARQMIEFISINIIPGAVLMGMLHVVLISHRGIRLWMHLKNVLFPIR